MIYTFLENEMREIRKVVEYSKQNIYQLDDVLDMMNGEMSTPGEDPGHTVRVGMGLWICYYLVEHPNKGRCHYFHFKPDITGHLPDNPEMKYILKEFGVENALLDEHITFDKVAQETKIILPLKS